MIIEKDLSSIIGREESSILEYKAVLPPSRNIAMLISSFANTEGGYIVLGILDDLTVTGLSQDFRADAITQKALSLLSPKPEADYGYAFFQKKKIYVINVIKSDELILFEGKPYKRIGALTTVLEPLGRELKVYDYRRIEDIYEQLEGYKGEASSAKLELIDHYQSIVRIIGDLGHILYPVSVEEPTESSEGKILTRILYSSFVDNFETYLSGLLYEIFLANPDTLKSQQTVTLKRVLDCSDQDEFIRSWAEEKVGKLQKGSVKGFIKENKQISSLKALDEETQNKIEEILQIRHLYTHKNGIIDKKFLEYFPEFNSNDEHRLSIEKTCDYLCWLAKTAQDIDIASINKYNLGK